jgi:mannose-1-phosphate guanylyltransferase / mannose-6-phosphate isomerase
LKLIPVILSGGAGTRLWPASREAEPKPFIAMPDGQSLLQKVLARAFALANAADVPEVIVVTNRDYLFRTVDERIHLPAGDYAPLRFVLEPVGRNTAPAIALAAHAVAAAHGPEAVLLVLPADHLINDTAAFTKAALVAAALASDNRLVTFGITPTRPDPGFGYIECGDALPGSGHAVSRFVEKPSVAMAQSFLDAGNYVWNSGMFCFRAGALLDGMASLAPDLARAADELWQGHRTGQFDRMGTVEFDPDLFAKLPNLSIDYAVMEKADNVACVRGKFDWSDIGSWQALSEVLPADDLGNRQTGRTMAIGTRNTTIHAGDRLVAAVGVDDLVIVDTPDAVLVAHRDRTQSVKDIVAELKKNGDERYRFHSTTARPWGSYTVLQEGSGFKIKRIEVKPGHTLSLQMHHRRSEHWVVVSGKAEVTCGERIYPLAVNESTFIPVGTKHRLANQVEAPLIMIEVQCGEYVGEDDIVRFDDRYGRVER